MTKILKNKNFYEWHQKLLMVNACTNFRIPRLNLEGGHTRLPTRGEWCISIYTYTYIYMFPLICPKSVSFLHSVNVLVQVLTWEDTYREYSGGTFLKAGSSRTYSLWNHLTLKWRFMYSVLLHRRCFSCSVMKIKNNKRHTYVSTYSIPWHFFMHRHIILLKQQSVWTVLSNFCSRNNKCVTCALFLLLR